MFASDPDVFGVVPARFTLVVGASGIVAGVVAIALVSLPLGLALLGMGFLLVGLAIEAARRWPASDTARFLIRVVDAISSRLGLARVVAGTWARAAREALRIRLELRTLRDQLEADQLALGAAAYREDRAQVSELRAKMRETDQQIDECEQELVAIAERAHMHVHRQRAAIQPTEAIDVEELRATDCGH